MDALPFLTAEIPATGGSLRTSPEDFRVEELPAYAPSGAGEHLYVTFEKRGMTTPDAVRVLARALAVDPRECGWAGLKDRHAVTVQTASFARGDAARALALELPGVRVLAAVRHKNKLKAGHLHGNRFVITARGCAPDAAQSAALVRSRLLEAGVPNYYGAQRFGRDGDNASVGAAWLRGERPPPREPFLRKMTVSALQSALFNAYVAARLGDGLLGAYVPGDLAVRHPVGGPFAISPEEAAVEYAAQRCSPSGPMFGRAMRWPDGSAREREERVLADAELTLAVFERAGALAEGTRRSVRLCIPTLAVEQPAPGVLVFSFELPAGGYATAVLREFRKRDDEGLQSDPLLGIEPSADAGGA